MDAAGKVLAEYVWLGPAGTLRCKTRVLDAVPSTAEDLPASVVSFDEPSASGVDAGCSDIVLKPRRLFRDPFRGGDHLLVLCDAFMAPQVTSPAGGLHPQPLCPHATNMRVACQDVVSTAERVGQAPLFAAEQEYAVLGLAAPSAPPCHGQGAWPHAHLPDPTKPQLYGPRGEIAQMLDLQHQQRQHQQQCLARSAGARRLSDEHLRLCLHAGLQLTACGEAGPPGVWSYKLGPLPGTELADQVWASRHVLIRLSEAMGIPVSFDPWGAAGTGRRLGCHIKFSTADSRTAGGTGLAVLQQYMGKLQATHVQHMAVCGHGAAPGWEARLADAGLLALPVTTALRGAGHLTDRRGSANADPWALVACITSATLELSTSFAAQVPLCAAALPSTGSCSAGAPAPKFGAVAAPPPHVLHPGYFAPAAGASPSYGPCKNALHGQLVGSAGSSQSQVLWSGGEGGGSPGCTLLGAATTSGRAGSDIGCPAASGGAFSASLCAEASLNTEDVLLQELDRMEGDAGCGSGWSGGGDGASGMRWAASCCSDGTSPAADEQLGEVQSPPSRGPPSGPLPVGPPRKRSSLALR